MDGKPNGMASHVLSCFGDRDDEVYEAGGLRCLSGRHVVVVSGRERREQWLLSILEKVVEGPAVEQELPAFRPSSA